nr:translation initiation factor IF-2 [Taeniopygia guttata]
MAEGKLHLKLKTGKWNFAPVLSPDRSRLAVPLASAQPGMCYTAAAPASPRLPGDPAPGAGPCGPAGGRSRGPEPAPHGSCPCQIALRAPLRPASPQMAPDTRPAQGSRGGPAFPGSPRVAAHQAGPPGREGSAKAGSEQDGSTAGAGLRLGPAGPLQAPAATAAAGATPYPAPGPGTARCSRRAEPSRAGPGRAEPERSRAAPNRTEAEPKPGWAERSRVEPSRWLERTRWRPRPFLRANAPFKPQDVYGQIPPTGPGPPLRVRAAPGRGGAAAGAGHRACAAPPGSGRAVRASRPRSARSGSALVGLNRVKESLCSFTGCSRIVLVPAAPRCCPALQVFVLWGSLLSRGTTAATAHFLCSDQFDFFCIQKGFLGPNLLIYVGHV